MVRSKITELGLWVVATCCGVVVQAGLLLTSGLLGVVGDTATRAPSTTSTAAASLLWPSNGCEQLPVLWFGANATGLQDPQQLELIARHALAIVSWGQGIKLHNNQHAEAALAEASAQARAYLDDVGKATNATTVLGVYRQIQVALSLFDVSRNAAANPANDHFWLHQKDNSSNIFRAKQPWGTADPLWNFTDDGARTFWIDNFTAEICTGRAAGGNYTVVYLLSLIHI